MKIQFATRSATHKWALFWTLLAPSLLLITPVGSSSPPFGLIHLENPNARFLQNEEIFNEEDLAETESEPLVRAFELWKPVKFQKQLLQWAEEYPDLIRVTTSQEKFGLPAAGGTDDCPFYEKDGCPNYIFQIQDFTVHPEGSYSSNHLPEVLWSGCLHGNERVGPTAVMEAAALLLEAAQCEALPRRRDSGDSHDDIQVQLQQAKQCRTLLQEKGIDSVHRRWLARLVTTRRIVVVPTANALGYFRNRREEDKVDPNRDFPYDLSDPADCMQTVAARTLNEVYREHMFQLALTFHAGMEVVAYEWGAPTWLKHLSPDDTAQDRIAGAYSRYGGGWSTSKPYQFGTMNDLVYYVRGGMEDWAYAGSWDPERVIQCQPQTFGGYDAEKTVYNNSTLRVFNMLIETSDKKEPNKSDLGTSLDVLNRDTQQNGHVSRNIRLALLAAEMVEPYVSFVAVNEVMLQDDIVPLSVRSGQICQKRTAFSVAKDATTVEVQFTVGGAITIDNVEIWVAKWSDIDTSQLDCLSQPQSLDAFTKGTIVGATNGTGFFSVAGSHPAPSDTMAAITNRPVFKAQIQVPTGLNVLDQLVVLASARVDQEWKNVPSSAGPNIEPQSHIVNARTNPNWHHHSADKHVVGRLDWFSTPLTIVIGDYSESVGSRGGVSVDTIDMYPRFHEGSQNSGIQPKSASGSDLFQGKKGLLLALAVACCTCMCCLRRRSDGRHSNPTQYKKGDGIVLGSHPYTDSYEDDDDLEDDELNDNVEMATR